jgi:hypothetical protein
MRDDYKQLSTPDGLEACPCCGSAAELWRYSEHVTSPTQTVACCSNQDAIGPQADDSPFGCGCPLYMPPNGFYCATQREAVKYWNEFAKALTALQRKNRWHHAKVTRAPHQEEES